MEFNCAAVGTVGVVRALDTGAAMGDKSLFTRCNDATGTMYLQPSPAQSCRC